MTNPVRFSHLKLMAQSPAHYKHALTHGREDTVAFRVGRIVDTMLLDGRVPMVWAGQRRGKEWEAFRAENSGEDIFTESEMEQAMPLVRAVQQHQRAADLLRSGRKERLEWEWLGMRCSGELDVHGGGPLVDLKTAQTSHPGRFGWHARKLNYHAQLWWYRNGMRQLGLPEPTWVGIVSVEKEPPHCVVVRHLTERTLAEGEKLCRAWMEQLKVCQDSDYWPGYAETDVDWDIESEWSEEE